MQYISWMKRALNYVKGRKALSIFLFFGLCACKMPPLSAKDLQAKSYHHPSLKIYYTPRATTSGGAGKWQLMVVAPNGKVYKDHKNGHIDMLEPPTEPLTFKIHKHLSSGRYTVMVYVLERTNNIPVDITSLAVNVLIEPSNGRDIISIQDVRGDKLQ